MARFVVQGGTPLRGEITPAGNKNEALPLIAASLLTDDPVTLHNVPRIRDVRGMLEVVSALDATPGGYGLHTSGLKGADVLLDEPSVTATENALMAAVLAPGRTVIRNAASEPHVQQLGIALMKMGARIVGVGTNTITIDGAERLKGIEHTILSDHMEVGSLIGAAAMTHGEITIKNAVPQYLRMTRLVFKRLGVETRVEGDSIHVPAQEHFVIEHDLGGAIPRVQSQIWPGFPSDLTSIATAMATQSEGTVVIHEWMFEGRLYFADALSREMGARIILSDPHRAVVIEIGR